MRALARLALTSRIPCMLPACAVLARLGPVTPASPPPTRPWRPATPPPPVLPPRPPPPPATWARGADPAALAALVADAGATFRPRQPTPPPLYDPDADDADAAWVASSAPAPGGVTLSCARCFTIVCRTAVRSPLPAVFSSPAGGRQAGGVVCEGCGAVVGEVGRGVVQWMEVLEG